MRVAVQVVYETVRFEPSDASLNSSFRVVSCLFGLRSSFCSKLLHSFNCSFVLPHTLPPALVEGGGWCLRFKFVLAVALSSRKMFCFSSPVPNSTSFRVCVLNFFFVASRLFPWFRKKTEKCSCKFRRLPCQKTSACVSLICHSKELKGRECFAGKTVSSVILPMMLYPLPCPAFKFVMTTLERGYVVALV